ncbi:transporter substrate-binding domain-containing protein [Noviherbaspirillum sp. Root189]|uniref:transporter substrate-binding domain-containing protein n=1 Tax=Noviherbaspirillum sp. Root189 TaxID=1736487 RepID=UPI00070D9E64|nr:transporter substrate-binding domain-containing protein [Noviherbaspirillum sp. Root189]KRB85184.1 amino acid ABC transporter substrate-binding protein [Noviherbaspirillum sp. Root189]
MNRRTVLSTLIVSVIALASTIAHADVLDDVIKNKTLRVAVPQDFPPFGSVGVDLKPVGYDIDVAKLIASQLGVVVEIVPVTSANRIPYLSTKKVDLVISSLGKNAEREKVIDFSDAYAPFFNGVFGLANQKVTKVDDLVGKTVGVTRGAIEDLELTKIAPTGVTIKRFEDNNTTISAFLAGQVPLVATGNVVAASISEKQPNKKPEVKFLIKNSPCHIGLNKNETRLLERVNIIIAKAKKDGSLNRIADKWLKAPLPADL